MFVCTHYIPDSTKFQVIGSNRGSFKIEGRHSFYMSYPKDNPLFTRPTEVVSFDGILFDMVSNFPDDLLSYCVGVDSGKAKAMS